VGRRTQRHRPRSDLHLQALKYQYLCTDSTLTTEHPVRGN
jgi:hypothetical protein